MTAANSENQWKGLDRTTSAISVTYDKADQLVAGFEPHIVVAQPDIIVGIARSGVVLAAMISQRIGKEFYCLRCQRHDDIPRWIDPPAAFAGTALLVDDFVSRGDTMEKSKAFLETLGFRVVTFSLYFDQLRTKHIPDISTPTSQFVRFAWERRESTNAALQIYSKADCMPLCDERESIGIDLDGILLPDLAPTLYEKNLQEALEIRDHLSAFPSSKLPAVDLAQVTVITGRPSCDASRTKRWLNANGFGSAALVCRDETQFGSSPQEMARHKAQAIQNLGISVYFESELLQATLIAQSTPTTETIWWGTEARLRLGGVSRAGWQA
jgi:adenine/guanine phosphoribosyltransferase-like PRPP-binding protein